MPQLDLFRAPPRPWNTGRMIGPKPPLKPKHVWAIRHHLKTNERLRDLALFNCAVDAKLRGCDLVKLTVSDVAPGGVLRERATSIQQKTGRPVPFEITPATREALLAWLTLRGNRAEDWLFPSRSRRGDHIGTREYGRLVDQWVSAVGLEPRAYGTHSLQPEPGDPDFVRGAGVRNSRGGGSGTLTADPLRVDQLSMTSGERIVTIAGLVAIAIGLAKVRAYAARSGLLPVKGPGIARDEHPRIFACGRAAYGVVAVVALLLALLLALGYSPY